MYYEIHGTGRPLVLLHGALTTIEISFGKVLPSLATTRQVIAVEQQAHGRTADIARPLTTEQMAEDTAALLRHLNIAKAAISATAWEVGSGCRSPSGIPSWCENSWSRRPTIPTASTRRY